MGGGLPYTCYKWLYTSAPPPLATSSTSVLWHTETSYSLLQYLILQRSKEATCYGKRTVGYSVTYWNQLHLEVWLQYLVLLKRSKVATCYGASTVGVYCDVEAINLRPPGLVSCQVWFRESRRWDSSYIIWCWSGEQADFGRKWQVDSGLSSKIHFL